jgi:hypothetical protein
MVMVKGAQPKTAFDLIRKQAGEPAVQAILALLSPEDREILTQPGLATRWVPLDTYTRCLKVIVQVAYKGDERGLTGGATRTAEIHAAGIYRSFTFITSPEEFIARLQSINETNFQGLTAKAQQTGPQSFVITYQGFEPQHRLIEYAILGWWTKMIEVVCGAKPKVKLLKSISSGGGEVALSVEWE